MAKFYGSFILCLAVLLSGSPGVWAQGKAIKGKVTAADDGTAIPGVNVIEKGTTNGTVTDEQGNYQLVVAANATLAFSFVGYFTQEVQISTQTTADVSLQPDVAMLSEIVVIGYGQQEKKDVTGSVIAIGSKDFNRGVLTSPQDLLLGKVAGVQITQNTGAPGSGSTIQIRGGSSLSATNDPLIVIDGFPVDTKTIGGSANPLATLNPNDIESFTVLKDASATAIYGSRASNGVIIVTTKKGGLGKPVVGYNGNVSVSSPINYFDVLSGDEIRALAAELAAAGTVSGLNNAALSRLGTANTDWQKEIYRDAVSHDHNVNVSGSARGIPYRVSYGYTDQQGTLRKTESKRNSLNVNLSPSFFHDDLKVNINAKASHTQNDFGKTEAIGAAVAFDPSQPVMNGNTWWGGYFTWVQNPLDINSEQIDLGPNNPVAYLDLTDNHATVKRLLGNVQIDYRLPFFSDLRVNVNGGIDYSISNGVNNTGMAAPWARDIGEGQRINYTGDNRSKLLDVYFNYIKNVGKNSKVDATAGYSYQSFVNDGTNFDRNWNSTKFYDYGVDYSNKSDIDGDTIPREYVRDMNFLLSFFGRVHYALNDKYLFTATLRSDGSSRFAEENRWGLFPAAAFAWNVKNEPFLQKTKALSALKLRLGYGITGQQGIVIPDNPNVSYPYLPVYEQSTSTAQYQFGNSYYPTLRPNAYDSKIKWEETTTYNAGVDFGFFGDKLTGTVDVYQRKTKDLLNNIQVAAGTVFSNYLWTNVGSLENKGIELTLNARAIDRANLGWNIGFNLTHNVNRITGLLRTDDPGYEGVPAGTISGGVGNMVQINAVGHPVRSFYTFEQVYGPDGMPVEGLYVDRTGSGGSVTSNTRNRYHNHSPYPSVMMGFFSSLRYKGFDLYLAGRANFGNYVYNNRATASTYSALYVSNGFYNNLADYIYDTRFIDPQYWSDIYVENASFFKMDNMSLGYAVKSLFTQKLKARFSFTVYNAFMITKYSGIDPEVNDGKNPGIDNNLYPRSRNFVFGINLSY